MADMCGFNAHTVEPNESFDPIPAGEYLCVITHTEDKPTKSGNGSYLEIEFEVLDGPYKGRKLWDRLNLANPNELAVKIAAMTSPMTTPERAWSARSPSSTAHPRCRPR